MIKDERSEFVAKMGSRSEGFYQWDNVKDLFNLRSLLLHYRIGLFFLEKECKHKTQGKIKAQKKE